MSSDGQKHQTSDAENKIGIPGKKSKEYLSEKLKIMHHAALREVLDIGRQIKNSGSEAFTLDIRDRLVDQLKLFNHKLDELEELGGQDVLSKGDIRNFRQIISGYITVFKEPTDEEYLILHGKLCPYCKNPPVFCDMSLVYGGSVGRGMVYLCKECKSYVGVHKDTNKALGRLANSELRGAKMEAHHWFDKIAKTNLINVIWHVYVPEVSNRRKAYMWLADKLGIKERYCHIGMFDLALCKKTIEISKTALESVEKESEIIVNKKHK